MNTKNLILVGGGGHCKSVIDVAESAGYNIIGILDNKELIGQNVLGYKILGGDDKIPELVKEAFFVITVGQIKDSDIRFEINNKIAEAKGKLATIISPTSYVSKHAIVKEGTVVMHKAVINAGAIVGRNCIINTLSNIEHDTLIGDFCHISTGAIINGICKLGTGIFVGSRAVLYQEVEIGDNYIVKAGSIINHNCFNK